MEILFTPAARSQLLELVAAMRGEDRPRAARLLDDLDGRLRAVAEGTQEERELPPVEVVLGDLHSVRLFTWVRAGTLWVLAVWSSASAGG